MNGDTSDMETTTAYIHYIVDCPYCGEPNDLGDSDPDLTHECDGCGEEFGVTT